MNLPALALFLVITLGGGIAIGVLTPPGDWNAALVKPPFNPPDWLFAPVWTLLYIAIAVAGWRILGLAPRSRAMRLWVLQMVLNFLWPPTVFGLHRLDLGLVVILALLASIFAFIGAARRIDQPAAWLFVPYALWVSFASLLNAALLLLNV